MGRGRGAGSYGSPSPRKTTSPRRTSSSSSSRRQGGREFKGSDSLHKSSGQILNEKRRMTGLSGFGTTARGSKRPGVRFRITEDHPFFNRRKDS